MAKIQEEKTFSPVIRRKMPSDQAVTFRLRRYRYAVTDAFSKHHCSLSKPKFATVRHCFIKLFQFRDHRFCFLHKTKYSKSELSLFRI